eukprot:1194683-Prorocentrum_minimum.AAC.2
MLLFAQTVVATHEAEKRVKYTYRGLWLNVWAALGGTGACIMAYAIVFVIGTDPIWDAQYVIPIFGMVSQIFCFYLTSLPTPQPQSIAVALCSTASFQSSPGVWWLRQADKLVRGCITVRVVVRWHVTRSRGFVIRHPPDHASPQPALLARMVAILPLISRGWVFYPSCWET